MDSVTSFKAAFDQYGGGNPARVLSIVFNNAYAIKFDPSKPFSYAEHLDEVNGYFKIMEKDAQNNDYLILKHIQYVETIVFAPTDDAIEKIDRRYIS